MARACDSAWGCSPTRVPTTVSRSSVFPACAVAFTIHGTAIVAPDSAGVWTGRRRACVACSKL
jgi:hypothetical protein